MHGLYDSDGILRFTGLDREACLAYARLFGLSLASCSLTDIPYSCPSSGQDASEASGGRVQQLKPSRQIFP
jgi:hypothetical protein